MERVLFIKKFPAEIWKIVKMNPGKQVFWSHIVESDW